MNNKWIFMAALAFTVPAIADNIDVASFDPTPLYGVGSYCEFGRQADKTLLASDWVGKFWMKVDGKIVEFASHRTDEEAERQLANKRWHEVLRAGDLTLEINFSNIGIGEDTAAYKGVIELKRRGARSRIPVTGGCAA